MPIPDSWLPSLVAETDKPYYQQLYRFVDEERHKYKVFPPSADVFNALRYTPFNTVRVVIIGQDPYHDVNQAHGLSFSVRPGIPVPPSLQNIYKELHTDIQFRVPNHGCLIPWAEQGVLLLNAVLTVRAHQANSHQGKGWENFTDAVLRAVNSRQERVVFLLWGSYAQRKAEWIDTTPAYSAESAASVPAFCHARVLWLRAFFKDQHSTSGGRSAAHQLAAGGCVKLHT